MITTTALSISLFVGCREPDPLHCNSHEDCDNNPALTYCDLTGTLPGSEGLKHTCVADPFRDGGLPDAGVTDAGAVDAVSPVDVASPIDATIPVDAPSGPVVTTNQAADLVLGQPDFATTVGTARNDNNFVAPSGLSYGNGRLWVSDPQWPRVLQWDALPQGNAAIADVVVGQTLFGDMENQTQQHRFTWTGVHLQAFSDGSRLIVVDGSSHRVLIWSQLPVVNGAPANTVLGQSTFTADQPGSLFEPRAAWTDGTRLVVADARHMRVLIWNALPTTDQAAQVVLGQPDFATFDERAPGPTALREPSNVLVHDGRLYVVDSQFHRVMVWRTVPTQNDAPADLVIGRVGFVTVTANAGSPTATSVGLRNPGQIAVAGTNLLIADTGNRRVAVHSTLPDQSGRQADAVLGQPDLVSSAMVSISNRSLGDPRGVAVSPAHVWVSDRASKRVLRFARSH